MPGLQRAMRSALLTLVLVFALVTAWACVIAGFVWMRAGRVGAGPALPSVGGGVIALIVPPLSVAAMARAPDWTRPSAKALSGGAARRDDGGRAPLSWTAEGCVDRRQCRRAGLVENDGNTNPWEDWPCRQRMRMGVERG